MSTRQPAKGRPKKPSRQRDGAPAVVEDARLPRMGELEIPPRRIRRRLETMPDEPKPPRGTKNLMEPVPRRPKRGTPRPRKDFGDQQEKPGGRRVKKAEVLAGYVRLRIRVEGRELSVVGAAFVEGPLVQPQTLHPGLSYEVKVGRRRVSVGDVPDQEWRSHPDPLGRPGFTGHHITRPESYEFTVRVPSNELSREKLPDTRITLRAWKGRGPGEMLEARALTRAPKREIATVGVLRGIELDRLPKKTQRELRKAIP